MPLPPLFFVRIIEIYTVRQSDSHYKIGAVVRNSFTGLSYSYQLKCHYSNNTHYTADHVQHRTFFSFYQANSEKSNKNH